MAEHLGEVDSCHFQKLQFFEVQHRTHRCICYLEFPVVQIFDIQHLINFGGSIDSV